MVTTPRRIGLRHPGRMPAQLRERMDAKVSHNAGMGSLGTYLLIGVQP